MGLLSLLASIPTAANLKLRLADCEKKCGMLEAQCGELKVKNADLEKRLAEEKQRNAALGQALQDCRDGKRKTPKSPRLMGTAWVRDW